MRTAALPGDGVAAFARLEGVDDPDAAWIVRENRRQKRLFGVLGQEAH